MIFQAINTTIIPPPKTAHNGRSYPNIIIIEGSPVKIIKKLCYNDCVLFQLILKDDECEKEF
jgi:hypothetical protein